MKRTKKTKFPTFSRTISLKISHEAETKFSIHFSCYYYWFFFFPLSLFFIFCCYENSLTKNLGSFHFNMNSFVSLISSQELKSSSSFLQMLVRIERTINSIPLEPCFPWCGQCLISYLAPFFLPPRFLLILFFFQNNSIRKTNKTLAKSIFLCHSIISLQHYLTILHPLQLPLFSLSSLLNSPSQLSWNVPSRRKLRRRNGGTKKG